MKTTLATSLKARWRSIKEDVLKTKLLNTLPYWIGSFIVGVVAIFYAKVFSLMEKVAQYVYKSTGAGVLIITPLCFVLAWWLVHKFAPYAKGSGIPQVSASIELLQPKQSNRIGKLLSFRIIIIKIISSLVLVLGGGAIGREGPTIQISASIFKKISDLFPQWYPKISKKNMIVTGAAAGLAAAFNTPLGGIVFAIEEITKTHFNFFKSALLTGVIIAGLTALYFMGPYLYLGYPVLEAFSSWHILLILPIAITTGLWGSGMGKIILNIFRKKELLKTSWHKAGYAAACGLALAVLAIYVDGQITGSGKEIMTAKLFSDQKEVSWYLPILRTVGPILSFSSGAAGGIFAPSLSTGATIGALFSNWFHLSDPETNLLILCGMTGFLTSITRSPFTSSILVLEMTNSHNVIFYIMITALISNLVGALVSKNSFYDYLKKQYIHEIQQSELKQ